MSNIHPFFQRLGPPTQATRSTAEENLSTSLEEEETRSTVEENISTPPEEEVVLIPDAPAPPAQTHSTTGPIPRPQPPSVEELLENYETWKKKIPQGLSIFIFVDLVVVN